MLLKLGKATRKWVHQRQLMDDDDSSPISRIWYFIAWGEMIGLWPMVHESVEQLKKFFRNLIMKLLRGKEI